MPHHMSTAVLDLPVTPEVSFSVRPLGDVLPTAWNDAPQTPAAYEQELVQVFKLLADETRLKIVFYLIREGELHVTALCDRLDQSQPAVSHHLGLLRCAGLINPRRAGKHNFYSLRSTRLRSLLCRLVDDLEPQLLARS